MTITVTDYRSPLGDVRLAVRDGRLCAMAFRDGWPRLEQWLARRFPGVARMSGEASEIRRRLDAYFGGELTALDEIGVDPGGTPFQQAVWAALRCIPVGKTTTYGALARVIGSPSAVRAVGAANGANPIWLVVPCHRAIGADGRLVGYAGGLERKRWLLTHEGAWGAPAQSALFAYASRSPG